MGTIWYPGICDNLAPVHFHGCQIKGILLQLLSLTLQLQLLPYFSVVTIFNILWYNITKMQAVHTKRVTKELAHVAHEFINHTLIFHAL
jgi:hypothetical protein